MQDYLGTRARFLRKWRHMKLSIFSKLVYRTSIIQNLINSLRAFYNKWLKWRSYSPFAYMLFCNLTQTWWKFRQCHCLFAENPIRQCHCLFAENQNFVNKLPLYTFNIQIMYDNLNFSFLLWNKLHLYFVTFLLTVSIINKYQICTKHNFMKKGIQHSSIA